MSLEISSPPMAAGTRTAVVAGAAALGVLIAIQAFVIRPAFELSRGDSPADPIVAMAADAADAVARPLAPAEAVPAPRDGADVAVAVPAQPAAAPDAQAATGVGLLVDLPPLAFVVGSSELTAESQSVLEALAEKINSSPSGSTFEIRTHTDTQGDAAYNQWLSEQRAMVVCDGLIHVGVDQERLSILGVGETAPLVTPEVTEADRQANRRVEIVPVS